MRWAMDRTPIFSFAEITRQQLRGSMSSSHWRTRKAPHTGGRSECYCEVAVCPDGEGLGRSVDNYLWRHGNSINGNDTLDANVSIVFGARPRRTRPIR